MNKKERLVAAIENGTVIDHIPTNKTYQVASLLGLFTLKTPVTIGFNYLSKKIGSKGMPKIMWRRFRIDPGSFFHCVIYVFNAVDIELIPVFIDKNLVRKSRFCFSYFQPRHQICPCLRAGYVNESLLSSLAMNQNNVLRHNQIIQ